MSGRRRSGSVFGGRRRPSPQLVGGGLGGDFSRKGGVIIAVVIEAWVKCGTCSVADENEVDAPSRATCR